MISDGNVVAAIYNGIYECNSTPVSLPDAVPLCCTANCAWGTYASLEVYASVADVSSYLALQAEVNRDYFVLPGAQFLNFEIVYPALRPLFSASVDMYECAMNVTVT